MKGVNEKSIETMLNYTLIFGLLFLKSGPLISSIATNVHFVAWNLAVQFYDDQYDSTQYFASNQENTCFDP